MTDDLVTRLRASRAVWENGGHRPTDDELEAAARIEQDAATIARLEGERDEALNQLDSARHSVDALMQRGLVFKERAEAAEAKVAALMAALERISRFTRLDAFERESPSHEAIIARALLDQFK